jgi:hypothetical protein
MNIAIFLQAFCLFVIALALFLLGFFLFSRMDWPGLRIKPEKDKRDESTRLKAKKTDLQKNTFEKKRVCPLCNSRLAEGEEVRSIVYSGSRYGRTVHIRGCPYCLGDTALRLRFCPVCKERLREDEYLIARLYEEAHINHGKPHLHIVGCCRCKES